MKGVVVIGAGKIGATVAGLLASTGDYQVTLADRSPEVLGNLDRDQGIRIVAADAEDSLKLVNLLNGQFAIINAAPFRLTEHVAEAARAAAQIAASAQQQMVGMDQVALAMQNIKEASVQNMAGTKQSESAAQNLQELGSKLKRLVEHYRV